MSAPADLSVQFFEFSIGFAQEIMQCDRKNVWSLKRRKHLWCVKDKTLAVCPKTEQLLWFPYWPDKKRNKYSGISILYGRNAVICQLCQKKNTFFRCHINGKNTRQSLCIKWWHAVFQAFHHIYVNIKCCLYFIKLRKKLFSQLNWVKPIIGIS
jgi:hypothetical protein